MGDFPQWPAQCIFAALYFEYFLPVRTFSHVTPPAQDQVHARQAEVAVAVGGRGGLGGPARVCPPDGERLGSEQRRRVACQRRRQR